MTGYLFFGADPPTSPVRLALPVRHRLRLRRLPGGLGRRAGVAKHCGQVSRITLFLLDRIYRIDWILLLPLTLSRRKDENQSAYPPALQATALRAGRRKKLKDLTCGFKRHIIHLAVEMNTIFKLVGSGGRDRSTARLTLGVGLAVSAFPLSVPV